LAAFLSAGTTPVGSVDQKMIASGFCRMAASICAICFETFW